MKAVRDRCSNRATAAVLLAATTLLGSCGGGGGSPGPVIVQSGSATMRGVVAVGDPVAGAAVAIRCVDGTGSATTDANGFYSVLMTSITAPCLVRASGGSAGGAANAAALASVIDSLPVGTDNVNVTPFTHLQAARVLGADPATAFDGCCGSASGIGRATRAAVVAAQAHVIAEIRDKLGLLLPEFDWVRGSFSATPDNLMDQYLERFAARQRELGRDLAQMSAEFASGNGELSLPKLPADAIECTPGLIAGFGGPFTDALVRVPRSAPDNPGGAGGDGGGAGGAGAGGAEGQLINVQMTVETRDPIAGRTVFGPVLTDAVNGMVTFVPCGYTGPALFTATGVAGSLYFDEALGGEPVSFANQTLRAAVPSITKNVGITRLTEAAVAQMMRPEIPAGSGLPTLKAVAQPWHDPGRIAIANDTVRTAINDQLPGAYRIDDITRLPVILGPGNATAPGVLTDNANGIYGSVLAGLAKTGASYQPAAATPAITFGQQFVADLADGYLNGRNGDSIVSTRTDQQAYNYSTLSSVLTINTGRTAAQLGAGPLGSARPAVQRVEAAGAGGTTTWAFRLDANGTVTTERPAGVAGSIALPAFRVGGGPELPIGRIEAVARSQLNIDDATSECGFDPNPTQCTARNVWRSCLVAVSADGTTAFSWRVGIAATSYVASSGFQGNGAAVIDQAGTAQNPVVSWSATSYDFGPTSGGMNLVGLRRDGTFIQLPACDAGDFHPGLPSSDNPAFSGRNFTSAFQDGGNRYIVFSDGTIRVWGQFANAMGIGAAAITSANNSNDGRVQADAFDPSCVDNPNLFCSGARPVVSPTSAAPLTNVVMMASGSGAYFPRALVRSGSDPATAGRVVTWGPGLPQPREIPNLQGICWIAGPYAVGCDGRLVLVGTSVSGGNLVATQTTISTESAIWRVREQALPATADRDSTQAARTYQAIARDGSIFRLSGTQLTRVGGP